MVFETVVHEIRKSKYRVTDVSKIHVFHSDQRTAVYKAVHEFMEKPATLDEITAVAERNGMRTKMALRAAVRLQLVAMVKDGLLQEVK